MLAIVQKEGQERRKRTRVLYWIAGGLVALQAASLGFMVATGQENLTTFITSMAPMICLIGIGAGMSTQAKSALKEAADSRDPCLVGHLFEALTSGDLEVYAMAKTMLNNILPNLGETAEPLDKVQHSAIVSTIALADEPFLTNIVTALRYVGRTESIPMLEMIARGKSWPAGKKASPKIQGLAQESLGLLRLRLAKDLIQRRIGELDELRLLKAPDDRFFTDLDQPQVIVSESIGKQ